MKIIWDMNGAMETTRLGDNIFMFVFGDKQTCDRIVEDQPWNFRGSLLLVDHVNREECLADFEPNLVPFWVQVHGLQIRAMNKEVGAEIGATLGPCAGCSLDLKSWRISVSCVVVLIM